MTIQGNKFKDVFNYVNNIFNVIIHTDAHKRKYIQGVFNSFNDLFNMQFI